MLRVNSLAIRRVAGAALVPLVVAAGAGGIRMPHAARREGTGPEGVIEGKKVRRFVDLSTTGSVMAQRLYKMRCECGRSWFELELPRLVQCPACLRLNLVSI